VIPNLYLFNYSQQCKPNRSASLRAKYEAESEPEVVFTTPPNELYFILVLQIYAQTQLFPIFPSFFC